MKKATKTAAAIIIAASLASCGHKTSKVHTASDTTATISVKDFHYNGNDYIIINVDGNGTVIEDPDFKRQINMLNNITTVINKHTDYSVNRIKSSEAVHSDAMMKELRIIKNEVMQMKKTIIALEWRTRPKKQTTKK